MKLRIVTLAVAVLIAFGLKRHYAEARAEELGWILGPTARLVGLMTGTTFAPEAGEGYLSRERMFVIEKACAGVNFMVAAFGMLVLALRHRVGSMRWAAGVLGLSLAASYVAAVLVNAVRIDIAMWLAAHPVALPMSAASVHRLEGVAVYFGGLLLLYELVHRLDGRAGRLRRAALPLGSYYAVAIGLPLINGAPWSAAFLAHAFVVLLVPLVLIALASIMAPEPCGRRATSHRTAVFLLNQAVMEAAAGSFGGGGGLSSTVQGSSRVPRGPRRQGESNVFPERRR